MERRYSTEGLKLETRDGGKQVFAGYAAVFYNDRDAGTQFDAGPFVERIERSAFDSALEQRQDVRGLFNHDPNAVLGRTGSGTMRLSKDQRGLKYEIDYNEADPDHVKVAQKIGRGDVTGSSFGFIVGKSGQRFTRDAGSNKEIRTISDFKTVLDVGPVTYPAYESTSSAMRSEGLVDAEKELADWRKEQEAVAVRLRLLEIE